MVSSPKIGAMGSCLVAEPFPIQQLQIKRQLLEGYKRFPLPSPHKSQRTNELWGDRKRESLRENLSLTWPTLRKKRDNGQVGKVRTYQVLGQPPSSHISLSFGCCGCPGHNSLLERSFLSFFGTVPS